MWVLLWRLALCLDAGEDLLFHKHLLQTVDQITEDTIPLHEELDSLMAACCDPFPGYSCVFFLALNISALWEHPFTSPNPGDLGSPYPCLPYRWWPAHSAYSPKVAKQGSRLWWPRQHWGWGAGCSDTQQWRHTQQLSLLKISWTPLLALQVWVHEFGKPMLFPYLIPVCSSGLLLTAVQAMHKSGFCKQIAFLKVPKTSLIILS